MGTQTQCLLQLCTPSSFISPSLSPNTFNNVTRCRFARSRSSSGRFRFYQEDDDGYDFRSKNKQRVWWSDIDDDDDDWDVDEDDEFWVFKIFRNFGWILPAVAVSALLGTATGPNTILMAIAVPLGQTLLSLVIDKVWAGTASGTKSRSRRKTKRKPFARAASNNKRRPDKENEAEKTSYEARGRRGSYQSWAAAVDDPLSKEGEKTRPDFGGWDELDKKAKYYKADNTTPRISKNDLPKEQKDKLSRRGKIRDRPLLVRLLIAVFPFLGSWTKLLF